MDSTKTIAFAQAAAVAPIGKSWLIKKAYVNPDGTLSIEGWVSTDRKDLDKDILEPETFGGATLKGYFERGGPISSEHSTGDWPVGYMRKSILVRDGNIFQEELNPRYGPVDFRYFDGKGTGWYGLGVIDEERAMLNVQKGKVSSFSWIGMPVAWTPLPDGGRHYNEPSGINPLLEATITAYPVNPTAVMRIAKARGYSVPEPEQEQRPKLALTREGVEKVLSRLRNETPTR